MKDWLLQYLVFSRKERLGLAVLLALIGCVWLLPEFFGAGKKPDKEILEKADSARIALADNIPRGDTGSLKIFTLFRFDPNTLDEEGWKKLGIRPKTISIIKNYLAKGGRFRNAYDLEKIYGLRPDELDRLIPYIYIAESSQAGYWNRLYQPGEKTGGNYPYQYNGLDPGKRMFNTAGYNNDFHTNENGKPETIRGGYRADIQYKSNRTISVIDINSADTGALIDLPGIGSRLAGRIILFREKLGGFYKIEQLSEVYGLQDTIFRLIRPFLILKDSGLRKININSAGFDTLNAHPYIQFAEARAIVQYRQQHGSFNDISDLLKISILTEEWIEKAGPYLAFDMASARKD